MRDAILTVERPCDDFENIIKKVISEMLEPSSLLVILSRNSSLVAQLSPILDGFGWHCEVVSRLDEALVLLERHFTPAFLVDDDACDPGDAIAAVRRLPKPANGTPVFTLGSLEVQSRGAGGHLSQPLDTAALIALLQHWAGPLDDHALRSDPSAPRYRLIRMLGRDNAEALLHSFVTALDEAITLAGTDPDAIPAHRLAGLSGMIGFGELSRQWSRVDRGEQDGLEAAVQASREALRALG